MTDIQTLKMAVAQLPTHELQQFSVWLDEFISQQWDKEIEQNIFAGQIEMPECSARKLTEIIAQAKGKGSFRSTAEIDEFIRHERNQWD